MVAGPYFNLNRLGFRGFRPCPRLFKFFARLVLIFSEIHYFGDRRESIWRYFDQVQAFRFRELQRFFYGEDAQVLIFAPDYPKLLRQYLIVYSFTQLTTLSSAQES